MGRGRNKPPRHVPLTREDHGGPLAVGQPLAKGSLGQRPVVAEDHGIRLSHQSGRGTRQLTLKDRRAAVDYPTPRPRVQGQEQDGLYLLHLPDGDAAYWERLFRKVTVDATLVTLEEAAGEGAIG